MAFEIIQGFNLSANAPIDLRFIAVDEDDMLTIKWVYPGLIAARIDTSPISLWICTADAATQPGAPNYTDMIDWEEFTGTAGLDGADGSQIYTAAGDPSDVLGENGDFYINVTSNDYFTKAGGIWGAAQGNIEGEQGIQGNTGPAGENGDLYATTSATSVDIDAAPATVVLTVETDLSYTAGQTIIVASIADPLVDYFTATVTAYSGSGLSLGSISYNGTGAHTDWDVNLTGAPGQAGSDGTDGDDGVAGDALIHSEYDITLDEAKVTSIQGGAWTPQAPWSASVQNDDRTNQNSPSGIIGPQDKNSITYNGTVWSNNGRWVGQDGTDAVDGNTPYIQTGNWWIDGVDTGIAATGPAGQNGEGITIYNHVVTTNLTEAQFLALPYDFTVPCELNLLVTPLKYIWLPNLNVTSGIKLRKVRMSSYLPRTSLLNTRAFQVKGRYDGNGLQTYGVSEIKGNDLFIQGGESVIFSSVIQSGTTYADYWLAEVSGVGVASNMNGGARDILGSVSIRLGVDSRLKGLFNFTVNNNVCHYGGWIQVHESFGTNTEDFFNISEDPIAFLPDPRAGVLFGSSTGLPPANIAEMPLNITGVQRAIYSYSIGGWYIAGQPNKNNDALISLQWDTSQLLSSKLKIRALIQNSAENIPYKYSFGGSYITATPYTIDQMYL